jgi:hypothetical protein
MGDICQDSKKAGYLGKKKKPANLTVERALSLALGDGGFFGHRNPLTGQRCSVACYLMLSQETSNGMAKQKAPDARRAIGEP